MTEIDRLMREAIALKAERDPLRARIAELERPYRNADDKDWEHLFRMLPDSGHGKFWKDVMREVRAATAKK